MSEFVVASRRCLLFADEDLIETLSGKPVMEGFSQAHRTEYTMTVTSDFRRRKSAKLKSTNFVESDSAKEHLLLSFL